MSGTIRQTAQAHPVVSDFLRPLRSVLLAVLRPDGTLMDANCGFRALLPGDADPTPPEAVRSIFLNPRFGELADCVCATEEAEVYAGLMTMGALDGDSASWKGRVLSREGCLLVVCERDVDQDRRVQQQLLELTEEYAQKERELARAHRQLAEYAERLEQLSLTDALTGLPNRRQFDAIMRHDFESAVRDNQPLAVLMIDLDHFKWINDTYGHQHGDAVLRAVAASLSDWAREADLVARWGGEEFAVLAPSTDGEGARILGERLRGAVEVIRVDEGPGATITVGVAARGDNESADALLGRADRALYRGKADGRNRVVLAAADE